jgi:hypothetical protein
MPLYLTGPRPGSKGSFPRVALPNLSVTIALSRSKCYEGVAERDRHGRLERKWSGESGNARF